MQYRLLLLLLTGTLWSAPATAADDPALNQAYQDHVAYVATFALPVLMEKCAALDPGYTQEAAPLYFRYVNARQDQIERGRLLTLAELPPGQTLGDYRAGVLATRLGTLDNGTREQQLKRCEGPIRLLEGATLPGEWPPRETPTQATR